MSLLKDVSMKLMLREQQTKRDLVFGNSIKLLLIR